MGQGISQPPGERGDGGRELDKIQPRGLAKVPSSQVVPRADDKVRAIERLEEALLRQDYVAFNRDADGLAGEWDRGMVNDAGQTVASERILFSGRQSPFQYLWEYAFYVLYNGLASDNLTIARDAGEALATIRDNTRNRALKMLIGRLDLNIREADGHQVAGLNQLKPGEVRTRVVAAVTDQDFSFPLREEFRGKYRIR